MTRKTSRKIRAAPKPRPDPVVEKARAIGMPEAQIQRGGLVVVDVKLALGEKVETNRTVRTRRTLVDRWFEEGGPGFEEPQRRAIDWVRGLWSAAGHAGPATPAWGEQRGPSTSSGLRQQDALTQLAMLREHFGKSIWNVFEDICRHDIAAGQAGSQLTAGRRSAHEIARANVGFVASVIGQWRGYSTVA